ncbi:transmembrane protein 182 [Dunckerocampus dactyliophorus]|uniref:transmembrane protein 182 n=1 Tax=Dunckerocampus dactyliophorus TaxID=161453 RepID=UPI0024070AA8|nr:transmembrane protein 182 [Dunckerocampus dactyliophorus]
MKLSVALFFAGLFGALAVVFVLLSFGTDYWLLAAENCDPKTDTTLEPGDTTVQNATSEVTLYHEGFFWRCSFGGNAQDDDLLWKLWFTNQPHFKVCMHSYLFPFPVSHHTHNATAYESAIIYRGFWSIFMLIGVAAVILGGFIIICAAPFANHCLYKTGGGLFLASGFFLLCVVVMFVLWIEMLDVVDVYLEYQRTVVCSNFHLTLNYGLSFMFAPVGIFFSLLAGLLFLLIGRTIKIHYH